jgi:citrate lyase subunit beta/citryl-CoA lyase
MRLKSFLYVAANRREAMDRALRSPVDAIVLDLEASVPRSQKDEARRMAARFLALARERADRPLLFARIDRAEHWPDDIEALVGPTLSGIRVPRAEDPSRIEAVDALIGACERGQNLPEGAIRIVPLIESVRGLHALAEMSAASRRIAQVAFAASDFVDDLRALESPGREETLLARAMLVLESRRLQLEPPVAHVHPQVADLEGLERTSREDRVLGFFGRSCIHVSQVPVVNAVYAHGAADAARARHVIAVHEDARRRGNAYAWTDDGSFVDEVVVRRAHRVLAEAAYAEAPAKRRDW